MKQRRLRSLVFINTFLRPSLLTCSAVRRYIHADIITNECDMTSSHAKKKKNMNDIT